MTDNDTNMNTTTNPLTHALNIARKIFEVPVEVYEGDRFILRDAIGYFDIEDVGIDYSDTYIDVAIPIEMKKYHSNLLDLIDATLGTRRGDVDEDIDPLERLEIAYEKYVEMENKAVISRRLSKTADEADLSRAAEMGYELPKNMGINEFGELIGVPEGAETPFVVEHTTHKQFVRWVCENGESFWGQTHESCKPVEGKVVELKSGLFMHEGETNKEQMKVWTGQMAHEAKVSNKTLVAWLVTPLTTVVKGNWGGMMNTGMNEFVTTKLRFERVVKRV